MLEYLIFILQIITLAFTIYMWSKRFGVEKFKEIVQKHNLLIKPRVGKDLREFIELVNNGAVTINETKVIIDIVINQKGKTETLPPLEYEIGNLNPKDKVDVPLFSKLTKPLEDKKLLSISSIPVPTGEKDEFSGEDVLTDLEINHILKQFSIKLSIEARCKIYSEKVSTKKDFELRYIFLPLVGVEPYEFEDNYEIEVNEIKGQWKEEAS